MTPVLRLPAALLDWHARSLSPRRALVFLAIVAGGYCLTVLLAAHGVPGESATSAVISAVASAVFGLAFRAAHRLTERWTDVGRSATAVHGLCCVGFAVGIVDLFVASWVLTASSFAMTVGFVWWGICLVDGLGVRLDALGDAADRWPGGLELLADVEGDLRAEGAIDHAERIAAARTWLTVEGAG